MADRVLLRPTPLEIASGVVVGGSDTVMTQRCPATALTALTALEQAMLPALQRPPCLVSFSGGMDSSFVLAIAARLARRAGLPAPIPVTWRFTDAPRAEESAWQERVIAALPIGDWSLLHAGDDLDLIGPVAARLLGRYGVLHPVNVHLHLPIVEMAAGGSLLTGLGGDQIFAGWRRISRLTPTAALRARVPSRVAAMVRRDRRDSLAWLRPDASRQVLLGHDREVRAEPRRLDRRIRWHAGRRDLLMTRSSLDALAVDNDVRLVNPLLEPAFLSILAVRARDEWARGDLARGAWAGGRWARGQPARGRWVRGQPVPTRSDLLVAIAGSELPTVATAARPKARFLEVFLRTPTRDFVQSWDGTGVDPDLVDADALAELWSQWPIPGGTAGLVQKLWLSRRTRPDKYAVQEVTPCLINQSRTR